MLTGILILLLFQLGGEVVGRLLELPIPGPVLGLLLLFIALLVRGSLPTSLLETARQLLSVLALLFVPAGVGIIAQTDLLHGAWVALAVTLLGSTVITMAVTALVMSFLLRQFPPSEDQGMR